MASVCVARVEEHERIEQGTQVGSQLTVEGATEGNLGGGTSETGGRC